LKEFILLVSLFFVIVGLDFWISWSTGYWD